MDFAAFWDAYEDIIRRARSGKLTTDDFAGTTISLTNPGTIGTNHSVPRLMQGQGTIIGVGAMEYPAEFSGMNPDQLVDRAISKIMTLTSTYDHRIIQGAQSGEFLRRMHELLLGRRLLRRDLRARCASRTSRCAGCVDRDVQPRGPDRQGRPRHRADQRLPHPRPPDGRHRPARVHRPQATPTSTSPSTA